jgi:hypothetical protein
MLAVESGEEDFPLLAVWLGELPQDNPRDDVLVGHVPRRVGRELLDALQHLGWRRHFSERCGAYSHKVTLPSSEH